MVQIGVFDKGQLNVFYKTSLCFLHSEGQV